jgi:uncharacterized membrane protein YkoI
MRWTGVLLAALLMLPLQAWAGAAADHERARKAMEDGQIKPLAEILANVDTEFAGRVIEVKLTDIDEGLSGWIYAITLLSPQDNVLSLKVDAGTGVILQVEGQGIEEARKAP